MSPIVMQHPFTNSAFAVVKGNDGKPEMINLLDPDNMRRWRLSVEKQIDKMDVRRMFYALLNKPYYLTALKLIQDDLSAEDFSAILAYCWISSEYPHMDNNVPERSLIAMFKKAKPEYLMDADELKTFNSMPDRLVIYRGVTSYNAKYVRAMAWSVDKKVADWFAHRFNENGTVYRAEIDKENAFAYFAGRNEKEIVVNPKYLENIERI